jgi:hypothetical protein
MGFNSVCEKHPWGPPADLIGKNPAPEAQLSLAQHGAEGGVLGNFENRPSPFRDVRVLTAFSSLRHLEMISSNSADVPIEIYTPERKAEFLLLNAVDERDYQAAVAEVRKLGIDPSKIPHNTKARKPRRS